MLFAFPLQKWLHERALSLPYTYNASIVIFMVGITLFTGHEGP
jgi:hypothetical protein